MVESWILSPEEYIKDAQRSLEVKARDVVRDALVTIGCYVFKPGDGVTLKPPYNPVVFRRACELLKEAGWDAEVRIRLFTKHGNIECGESNREEGLERLKKDFMFNEETIEEMFIGLDIKAPLVTE